MAEITHIQNGEEGGSVREKLNRTIDHTKDFNNPHKVRADQVPVSPPIPDIDGQQTVQSVLEWLAQYGGQAAGAGLIISPTPPKNVPTGTQWLDSTTAEVWIWDEDKWLQFPVVGGGANVQIENRPPGNAEVGDMWTDYGTTGELYIWDGRFWVSMTGDGGPKVIVGGGDENPDIDLPENLVFDRVEDADDFDKALARFISSDNTGKWGRIKTSDIETNPDVTFRDSKGRFKSTKEYEGLTDQLKVNRFLDERIEKIEAVDLDGYATTEQLTEVDRTSQIRDEALDAKIDQESNLNTAAHLKLEDQILRYYAWSVGDNEKLEKELTAVDDDLQAQIDDLAAGEVDLSGYATTDQLTEVDRTSQTRDEILDEKIDQESTLNTAAHLKIENQILLLDQWSTEGDEKLQAQIDNIADALPESPDNSLSIDIGEQVVKITGSRPVGGAGEEGKVLIWKAQRGGPATPYNECKFVAPDVDVIDLERDAIWLKQGDKVQQWYIGDPGWITNGNVVHYSALSTFGDTLIDGAPVDLWYEDPRKAPAEYLEVITRAESKADDRVLQAEIDQIGLALETLLVQREHGQWKYVGFTGDTIPRNAGEFSLASDDLSANDNIITLNQEDLKGTTHGFGDVEVGDYVEIVDLDEPANYVLFVVTKAPEGSGIVNVEVSLKDKGQNILIGETCEIRFFQVNDQNLQLEDLDNRYLRLAGGAMAGSATLKVNFLEPVNTPMIQYNGDPDSTHAAGLINRYMMTQYVKAELDKAPKSSQPMSAKLMVGFQVWSEGRLSEGCFNLLDENKQVTSKLKSARFITFHIIQSWDHVEWFWYALRGKGQIHLTDKDGKWLMSKFVIGAEKRDAVDGSNPVDALWFIELEEYGFDVDVTLSGNYFMEFDSCLEQA